jgi:hypothetical protein
VLEYQCESAYGRPNRARIVLPRSKVKEVQAEHHGGPSGDIFVSTKETTSGTGSTGYNGATLRVGAKNVTPAQEAEAPGPGVGTGYTSTTSGHHLVCRSGDPRELHSDQARNFVFQLMKEARGKSPKLQQSWEGPCKLMNRINCVVNRIQRHSRAKMMVVHLERLAPYIGVSQNEQPYGGSCVADTSQESRGGVCITGAVGASRCDTQYFQQLLG